MPQRLMERPNNDCSPQLGHWNRALPSLIASFWMQFRLKYRPQHGAMTKSGLENLGIMCLGGTVT